MEPNLSSLIDMFADRHVVVIGEAMLDRYLRGQATRLCQEAPVPVVTLSEGWDRPGGAANVAVNLSSLGARVSLISVIGDDEEGDQLHHLLEHCGLETASLCRQPARRTLMKSRIMAGSQLLVRLDQGSVAAIAPASEQQLIEQLTEQFARCDAVIISDYSYGVMTPRIRQTMVQLQARCPKLIAVDAKDLTRYQTLGATLAKPNYAEAIQLLATPPSSRPDDHRERQAQITQYREQLLTITGAKWVVVTLDADGAIILQHQESPQPIPAPATSCISPTGAGDTYLSALTLALAVGASITKAAELAATAAAIAIAKAGTATCAAQELQQATANETALPLATAEGIGLNRSTLASLTPEVA